jgi:hypothetical protein
MGILDLVEITKTCLVGMQQIEPGKAGSKIRNWPRKAISEHGLGKGRQCQLRAGKRRPEHKKTALPVLADK